MGKLSLLFTASLFINILFFNTAYSQSDTSLTIIISDNGAVSDSLIMGESSFATAGLDVSLGEFEMPPIPPSGAFDVRWLVSGYEGLKYDYVGLTGYNSKRNYWNAQFQPSTGGYPIKISWDTTKLGNIIPGRWNGQFYIYDGETGGQKFNVDMSKTNSITITDPTTKSFIVMHVFTVQKSIQYSQGWNLLSVPVEEKDWSFADLFPLSAASAYKYTGSYLAADSLNRGSGFWVKLNSNQTSNFTGEPFVSDTFNINSGWNMIGSIVDSVSVSGLSTIPANLISSFFFNFKNGYKIAQTVLPGSGYWLKSSAAGKLIINSTVAHKNSNLIPNLADLNKLMITDANGNELSLYFTSNKFDNSFYDMPPKAADEIPDIRFTSGKIAESFNNIAVTKNISLQGLKFPISVKAMINDKADYLINNGIGNNEITLNETPVILNKETNELKLTLSNLETQNDIPKQFQLNQNYPNPFNPTTIISYSVPKSSLVTIKIYDILGRVVETLVNEQKVPGNYKIIFNADKLSSGVYFYGIRSSDFVSIKKMILLQ